jgi:hypothetical protein
MHEEVFAGMHGHKGSRASLQKCMLADIFAQREQRSAASREAKLTLSDICVTADAACPRT